MDSPIDAARYRRERDLRKIGTEYLAKLDEVLAAWAFERRGIWRAYDDQRVAIAKGEEVTAT